MSGRGAQLAALEEKGGRYVDSGIGPSTKRKEKELRARQGDDEILQANRHRKRRARSEQKDRGEKGKDLWNFVKPDSNHPSRFAGLLRPFFFFLSCVAPAALCSLVMADSPPVVQPPVHYYYYYHCSPFWGFWLAFARATILDGSGIGPVEVMFSAPRQIEGQSTNGWASC
jgi:hypothetical protein